MTSQQTQQQVPDPKSQPTPDPTPDPTPAPSPASRVRKNIDDLTPQELADFEYAVQKLVEISENDPNSMYGYLYYQAMHDDPTVGPCEHGLDTFLPWHRMLLWVYEDGLRKSDPPRTSNVTLPYWDWSKPPSGQRYAKAFEDQSSILYTLATAGGQSAGSTRNTTPVCPAGAPASTSCERLPFPYSYLSSYALNTARWSAPPTDSDLSFGGADTGKGACDPGGSGWLGFGRLENPAHNSMHSLFIGGFMADPSTAAQDPIFWSFHCFIDLLFEQWQAMSGHKVDTCLQCGLCWTTPNPDYPTYKVQDMLDISGPLLGYSYDYTPPAVEEAPKEALVASAGSAGELFPTHPAKDIALSGRKEPESVYTTNVTIPESDISNGYVRLQGVKLATPVSYSGDVYLTPQDVEFNPQDPEFRETYFADLFTVWKGHAGHDAHTGHGGHGGHDGHDGHDGHGNGGDGGGDPSGSHTTDIVVDLTPQLRSLSQGHAGETWKVTVALVTNPDDAPVEDAVGFESARSARESLGFENINIGLELG